jgi:hypothetical protein
MPNAYALQRTNTENIAGKGIARPQSLPHSAYSAAGNMCPDPGNIYIAHRHMNMEIGTEAAQFPEKKYINGIFVAVCLRYKRNKRKCYAESLP